MKKGFTLMEMMAVIGILALLTIIILPKILNEVNDKRDELSDAAKKMIYSAADLYMNDNITDYSKVAGKTYCIKLEQLVKSEYLKTPLKDATTGKEINLTKGVKLRVDKYNQYDNYQVVESCDICTGDDAECFIYSNEDYNVSNISVKDALDYLHSIK